MKRFVLGPRNGIRVGNQKKHSLLHNSKEKNDVVYRNKHLWSVSKKAKGGRLKIGYNSH